MSDKKEASVAGGLHGVQAPSTPMFRKQPPKESSDFQDLVTYCTLNDQSVTETVKKRGESWVVFDDKTGVEKGVYADREKAWERQRLLRKQSKNEKTRKYKKHKHPHSDKAKKAPEAEKAPKAKKAPHAHLALKSKTQKEQYLENFKETIRHVILTEGSALSYVFEQSPVSDDTKMWEMFLEKISKQTLLADPKLMGLLQLMAKNEVKSLGLSVKSIKDVLEKTGLYEVNQDKPDQDDQGNLLLGFQVKMIADGKKLDFAIKLENGKPLIQIPDQTRLQLNSLNTSEAKLLRSELIHIQETVLNAISDVINTTGKRNDYLKKMQTESEKFLKDMSPLQIIMLRYLLKGKYKHVK